MINSCFYKCFKSNSTVNKQINDVSYFEWITFLYPTNKSFFVQAISMATYFGVC